MAAREAAVSGTELVLSNRYAQSATQPFIRCRPCCRSPSRWRSRSACLTPTARDARCADQRTLRDRPQLGARSCARRARISTRSGPQERAGLEALLASCFRNEMTTGMFGGGRRRRLRFVRRRRRERQRRNPPAVQCVEVQRREGRHRRLASPPVGNPYGVWIDNGIVHPNTFLNDYRAEFVLGLGRERRPADRRRYRRRLRRILPSADGARGTAVYVGFDLPDNLLVASYYLLSAHPDKRVLLYGSENQRLDAETLRNYDVVLMPNFMLPRLADNPWTSSRTSSACRKWTTGRSRSTRARSTACAVATSITRTCSTTAVTTSSIRCPSFRRCRTSSRCRAPRPAGRIFSPTSPHHCHGEFLSVRRDIDHQRYLSVPSHEWARAKYRNVA